MMGWWCFKNCMSSAKHVYFYLQNTASQI